MKQILIALILLTTSAAAQTDQPCFIGQEAEELTLLLDQYQAYSRALQWDSLTMLMDTTELVGFKEIMVGALRQAGADADMSAFSMIFEDSLASIEEVEKIPPGVFFAKFMGFMTEYAPEFAEIMKSGSFSLVGCLRESEATGYAVIKVSMQYSGETIDAVDVIPLRKRADGRWFVGMKADFKQLASALVGGQ